MRNSPYAALAARLIRAGVRLQILDRHVRDSVTREGRATPEPPGISNLRSMLASDLDSALEGSETVIIGHLSKDDREALPEILENQAVIDLAGIPELVRHPRIAYQGLSW